MRRIKAMRMVFVSLLLLLCGRLYYVQILCGDDLTAAAKSQQLIPVVQENGLGTIYDRHMEPLTGTESVYYYLIHKDNLTAGAFRLLERMDAEPAGQKGEDYLVYRAGTYQPDASYLLQKQHKAYGFAVDVRYGQQQMAKELVTDLDAMYGELLKKDDPAFYFLGNAAGGLIHGKGVSRGSADDGKGGSLVTTLDAGLQQELEEILDNAGAIGCAVVTDCGTGQVLAMVSRSEGGDAVAVDADGDADGDGVSAAAPNLAVEQAYPLGKAYALMQKTAAASGLKPSETASALGLGTPVFTDYPGEDAGLLDGKKTTATAVQLSRALTAIASGGNTMPLTLVMSTRKEESIPCMEVTGDAAMELEQLRQELTQKPLTGDGWAAGYCGTCAIVVHLEQGKAAAIYHSIKEQ